MQQVGMLWTYKLVVSCFWKWANTVIDCWKYEYKRRHLYKTCPSNIPNIQCYFLCSVKCSLSRLDFLISFVLWPSFRYCWQNRFTLKFAHVIKNHWQNLDILFDLILILSFHTLKWKQEKQQTNKENINKDKTKTRAMFLKDKT